MNKLYYDQTRINELTDQAVLVVEEILDELGVQYRRSPKRIYGCCPIHGGDNPLAFNLFPEGYNVRGMWVCHTHHCERKWKQTFIGFIHGMLSRQTPNNIPWTVAVDWLCNFLKYDSLAEVTIPTEYELKKRATTNCSERWSLTPEINHTGWTRFQIRQQLEIPAKYYKKRGFSDQILDKYDVGLYTKQRRVVIPVYDEAYRFAVGFTKRSIYPRCSSCSFWHHHSTPCPTDYLAQARAAKWIHSDGFNASSHLYNYWFSKQPILDSGVAIIVEGPGDVWKLEEHGINNSVALFGVDITDDQLHILETSGAMGLVVLLDNDNAGQEAAKNIYDKCSRMFRMYFPTISASDVGDLQADAITKDIKPFLDKAMRAVK